MSKRTHNTAYTPHHARAIPAVVVRAHYYLAVSLSSSSSSSSIAVIVIVRHRRHRHHNGSWGWLLFVAWCRLPPPTSSPLSSTVAENPPTTASPPHRLVLSPPLRPPPPRHRHALPPSRSPMASSWTGMWRRRPPDQTRRVPLPPVPPSSGDGPIAPTPPSRPPQCIGLLFGGRQ